MDTEQNPTISVSFAQDVTDHEDVFIVNNRGEEVTEKNGEPFDFNKDFFMLFPKDMDEGILNEIAAAMQKVCENPDFQAEMAGLLYSAVTAEEADLEASRQFISDKRDIGQEIIDVAPGLDELT